MFHRLLVEKDVPIPVRDGGHVFANVFRPADAGEFPVIITLGPYPKDIHFSQWNPAAWKVMPVQNEHMHWETVDPEWWVPQGYAVVRCDTRGTGKSPGRPRLLSRAEAEDFCDCVEWAGTQSWSCGRVAVMGVSYFAMNAWRVAALRPPHLAAIVPWEGAVDLFRDAGRHGGIFSAGFMRMWGGHVRRHQTDGGASDPAPLPPETIGELHARNHPNLADIEVPLLMLAARGDELVAAAQMFAAEKLVATPPAQIKKMVAACNHLGLFMGTRTLTENWPAIARWMSADAEPRAISG